jgi:O-antigen biosynthesis protein
MLKENSIRLRTIFTGLDPRAYSKLPRRVMSYLLRKAGYARPGQSLSFLIDLPDEGQLSVGQPSPPTQLRLGWIIPDFSRGSGGHATIFNLSAELNRLGFINEFWLMPDSRMPSTEFVQNVIQKWFTPQNCTVRKIDSSKLCELRADICIATEYRTAYIARAIPNMRRKFYLVQDFEPWFFPCGVDYWVAAATYHMRLEPITAGRWLASEVGRLTGLSNVNFFDLAYDAKKYYMPATQETGNRLFTVAFYLRETTPRRCADLGLLALELANLRLPNLQVHLFGQPRTWMRIKVKYIHHGILSPEALGNLYRKVTLGLVLSATNHSLVPCEMMACGIPVIELDTPSNRMDFPVGSLRLAGADPQSVADAIVELLTDEEKRKVAVQTGLSHVASLSWSKSGKQVAAYMR